MKNAFAPASGQSTSAAVSSLLDSLARRALLSLLGRLQYGELILVDNTARHTFGSRTTDFPYPVTIKIHNPLFYRETAFGGDVGGGEAYIKEFWSCDDLTTLVRILLRNRQVLDVMDKGWAWVTRPVRQLFHALRRNTKEGSRKNIAAHYDLGNQFFEILLDDTMMYSCAIFEREDSTLYEASVAKNDRICRKLQLSPADHVLEIGSGWGGFALHAAQHYGCRVTTTTISKEQFQLVQQRVAAAGLTHRVTILLQDYRDLRGAYDKLVSIEMIEAVGHHYLDAFFQCCGNLLKPDGMMLLQAITIADQYYERARRSVDFIKHFIFPGSFIPSVTAMCNSLTKATDLRLFHLEDQGAHYATTLRHWRERLFANLHRVRALGYPEAFIRMWEYYLCYCEGGFHERALGDVQMLLIKPRCRRAPLQPPLPLANS
jgi:cyclopropane-fatty-acyl-phospholipid synthase